MSEPHLSEADHNQRIFAIGVHVSVCIGVLIYLISPTNFLMLPFLYGLPLLGIVMSGKGTSFKQHSQQALLFSVLFSLVYPLLVLAAQFAVFHFNGQATIGLRLIELVENGDYGIVRASLGAASAFNDTSREIVAIIIAFGLALVQAAIMLQLIIYPPYNMYKAFKNEPADYPKTLR